VLVGFYLNGLVREGTRQDSIIQQIVGRHGRNDFLAISSAFGCTFCTVSLEAR